MRIEWYDGIPTSLLRCMGFKHLTLAGFPKSRTLPFCSTKQWLCGCWEVWLETDLQNQGAIRNICATSTSWHQCWTNRRGRVCWQGLPGTSVVTAGRAVTGLGDNGVTHWWHRCFSASVARLTGTWESQPDFFICLLHAKFQRRIVTSGENYHQLGIRLSFIYLFFSLVLLLLDSTQQTLDIQGYQSIFQHF